MNNNMIHIKTAMELFPGFQYLFRGDMAEIDFSVIEFLLKQGWALESSDEARINAVFQAGMDKNDIYGTSFSSLSSVKDVIGKCRFVASDMDELRIINEAAAGILPQGHLESVGISVVLEDYDNKKLKGFRMTDISELSAFARKLPYISLRGCFLKGDTHNLSGESLGRYIQNCYETAKQISTLVPCKISYVDAAGCMEPVFQTIQEGREVSDKLKIMAEIVNNLNQTSFYAKLLIQ